MNKIIIALNSMIEHRDKITDVINYKDVYYFCFTKYVWSIEGYNLPHKDLANKDGTTRSIMSAFFPQPQNIHYSVTYYPDYSSIIDLKIDLERGFSDTITKFVYTSESDSAVEVYDTYEALYNTVREKLYNIDNVLDDIISLGAKKGKYKGIKEE